MSLAVRPRLAPSVRCTKRQKNLFKRNLARYQSTDEGQRLETPLDWIGFQTKRDELRSLIDIFTAYGSTQNSSNAFHLRDSLRQPPREATISALMAAGAHFGHASTRMNPNFMPYAYGTRAGITVIDLDSTLPLLRQAANVVRSVALAGGQILFIGTRPDLKPVVERAAERLGMQGYHVGERWIPGTLTNKQQLFTQKILGTTNTVPDLVILLNPLQNAIAIREVTTHHVPTIGIIDSNVDPRIVMYPIPANDENTRTAELIAGVLSVAGREGAALRVERQEEAEEKSHKSNRLRNWNVT